MTKPDMTIIAISNSKEGGYTGWIRGYSGIIAQTKTIEEIRPALIYSFRHYIEELMKELETKEMSVTKITKNDDKD